MNRVRNAVIIIILCIIGLSVRKVALNKNNGLGLATPPADEIRDAVAGGPAKPSASKPKLGLPNLGDDNLRDALAEGPAIPTGLHNKQGPRGNTEDQTPPPPRGGDHNGIGPLGGQNPGAQLPPHDPPPLSPSNPPATLPQ